MENFRVAGRQYSFIAVTVEILSSMQAKLKKKQSVAFTYGSKEL